MPDPVSPPRSAPGGRAPQPEERGSTAVHPVSPAAQRESAAAPRISPAGERESAAAGGARAGAAPGTRRLVDLTLLVAEELPCWWSTHMPFQHKTFNYFADRGDTPVPLRSRSGPYQTRWMLIDEHTGTHVDAPAHFIPPPGSGLPHAGEQGLVTVDRVPLDQMAGPAAVIDVPDGLPGAGPGISPLIGPDLLDEHERRHGAITAGTVVLLRTRWDRHYQPGPDGNGYCSDALLTRTGPGWPAPDVPLMGELLDRGVRCVGTDAPSMGSSHDGAPVHVAGLSRGAVFVEALTGLGQLPARGAYFQFTPLKVARGTGAPGRAMAWLPETAPETPPGSAQGAPQETARGAPPETARGALPETAPGALPEAAPGALP